MHRPWVGAWATAPQLVEPSDLPPAPGLSHNTLRQVVFPTLGGSRLRVHFSNQYGASALTLNGVELAAALPEGAIDEASRRALRFGGAASATIPAEGTLISDPLDYELTPLVTLAVTAHFGDTPRDVTGHPGSRTTSYLASGDAAGAASLPSPVTTDHWYCLTGIDVEADVASAALVTIGDSITDGRGSTTNGNDRWPDVLARRLQANPATTKVAVLNQGIGGNAVLSMGLGPSAFSRFERDVIRQAGVRWVIVLAGVNDIGNASGPSVALELIGAYRHIIDRAHDAGILAYGAPILPLGGSHYDNPDHEAARQSVNRWIRASGNFDAVIDLDAAVRDPSNPLRLLPAYDSGDFLHLSPAGYRALANAIDLALFTR